MTNNMLSWGKEIWENKITRQNETGVIFGLGFTSAEINKQTIYAMHRFRDDVLPLIKPRGKILDVGVGPMARYSIEFAKHGYSVVGLDISKTTLKHASKYIRKAKLDDIKLKRADMVSFVDKQKYDFLFCIGSFYHIPAHLGIFTLRNFNKMLTKNGYALIEFNVIKRERKLKEIAFELIYHTLFKATRNIFKRKALAPCIAGYTEDELQDMLRRTSFKLEKKLDYNKFRLNNIWLLKKMKGVDKL